MSRANATARVVYFGKLPSRGDFVRSVVHPELIHTIDDWLARGMDLLSNDVRWKLTYDEAAGASFAFMGSRSRVALSGHLTPSFDASRRRYPFVMASTVEVDQPLHFISRSPLALSAAWTRLADLSDDAFGSDEASPVLEAIAHAELTGASLDPTLDEQFSAFLDQTTVGEVEDWLLETRHALSLRRSVLALGMLLQPLVGNANARLDKALMLPLPLHMTRRWLAAALWCDLVARFLAHSDVELSMFVGRFDTRPGMLLGFNGASARAFQSLIDPQACRLNSVAIAQADWVDEWVEQDYGLRKLSDYMAQRDLSLRQMTATFSETFLGA